MKIGHLKVEVHYFSKDLSQRDQKLSNKDLYSKIIPGPMRTSPRSLRSAWSSQQVPGSQGYIIERFCIFKKKKKKYEETEFL